MTVIGMGGPAAPWLVRFGAVNDEGQPPDVGWLRIRFQATGLMQPGVAPGLTVDGQLVRAEYGVNDYCVHPGQHTIGAYLPIWTGKSGYVELGVLVPPGGGVEVWYAPPFNRWASGQIGFVPQKRQGAAFWVVLATFWLISIVFSITAPLWTRIILG